jgi:hypothetical protein
MAQQTINVGAAPNDGTGTPLRTAFQYTNSNFTELYTAVGPSGNNIVVPGSATITGDLTVDTSTLKVDSTNNRVGIGTANPITPLDVRGSGGTGALFLRTTDPTSAVSSAYIQTPVSTGFSALVPIYGFWYQNCGMGNPSSDAVTLITASTERYRIDSAGTCTWSNVGGGAGTAMTLNSTGLGVGDSPATKIFARVTPPGAGQDGMRVSDGTRLIQMSISGSSYSYQGIGSNQNVIYASGNPLSILSDAQNLRLGTSSTSYLLLDSSGNVGIGVTPKSWASGYRALQIGIYSALTDSQGGATYLTNNAYFDSVDSRWEYITNNRVVRYDQDTADGGHKWYSAGSGAVNAAITWGNPLMTLDASGNLLVGTTDATQTSGVGTKILGSGLGPYVVNPAIANSALAYTMYSTGATAYRFYVGWAGTVFATNTVISAISDARLKENVQNLDVGLNEILALKPRKFDWKAGKGKDIKGDRGFIAQEFETVFPNLIDEWADPAPEGEAPYKSVRQDLIPVLVKAIQELAAEVNALKKA